MIRLVNDIGLTLLKCKENTSDYYVLTQNETSGSHTSLLQVTILANEILISLVFHCIPRAWILLTNDKEVAFLCFQPSRLSIFSSLGKH